MVPVVSKDMVRAVVWDGWRVDRERNEDGNPRVLRSLGSWRIE